MTDTFEELAEMYQETENNSGLTEGDDCPEDDCGNVLIERHHPRTPRLDTDRHPEAPETEVICTHHGVVESF